MTYTTRFRLSKYAFYYHKEYILGHWSCIKLNKGMVQEEIYQFIDNLKYFTAILALCFNSPTLSIQSVSMSAFWIRPEPPLKHQKCQYFCSDLPLKRGDVILECFLKSWKRSVPHPLHSTPSLQRYFWFATL